MELFFLILLVALMAAALGSGYPVAFALLEIGGCHQHAEPEAGQTEDNRGGDEPGRRSALEGDHALFGEFDHRVGRAFAGVAGVLDAAGPFQQGLKKVSQLTGNAEQ